MRSSHPWLSLKVCQSWVKGIREIEDRGPSSGKVLMESILGKLDEPETALFVATVMELNRSDDVIAALQKQLSEASIALVESEAEKKHLQLRVEQLEADNSELRQELQQTVQKLMQSDAKKAEQARELADLKQRLAVQEARAAYMQAEMADARQKQAFGKCHVPSSRETIADKAARQKKRRENKSLRAVERERSSTRPKGGQKGHKGHGLKLPKDPDISEEVHHYPEQCRRCPHWGDCQKKKMRSHEVRHVLDLAIQLAHYQHMAMGTQCPLSGQTVLGTFPADITGSKQYGDGVRTMSAHLFFNGAMSYERVADYLAGMGIPMSMGTVHSIVQNMCSQPSLTTTVEHLKGEMRQEVVVHADETGVPVDNANRWTHLFGTRDATIFSLSDKRGAEGMLEAGILPGFKGVVVHDCWASYWNKDLGLSQNQHALCHAHIIRELLKAQELFPEQRWIADLIELELRIGAACKAAIEERRSSLKGYKYTMFRREYMRLIHLGQTLHPKRTRKEPGKRGRIEQSKIFNLLARLEKHFDALFRCARDVRVPFTNNLAEQAAKCIKVREKISGCFATRKGAEDYLRMLSYLETARKRGITAFQAIRFCRQDQCHLILKKVA